jgi:methylase of polypeptide subunit release factors
VVELVERGGGLTEQESRLMLNHAIAIGRGGVLGFRNSESCMSERRSVSTPAEWWQAYIGDCGCEKPSRLSQLLAETIPAELRTKKLLDIGCGTGIIGLYCLLEKKAGSVTFIDILHEWIDITRANVSLKIEEGAITSSQVDVLDAMPFDRILPEVVAQHDMVVFNLPQFPEDFVAPSELSKIGADPIRARYRLAGRDGLKLARNFCQWYAGLRQPKPDAVFVLWSILGKRQIAEALKTDSFQWKTIQETPVPLKPEFSRAAAEFFQDAEERDNRMLVRDGDGWTNHVLTIRLTDL